MQFETANSYNDDHRVQCTRWKRGEMKVIHVLAFLIGFILIMQAFLTACPTFYYDMQLTNHDDSIGEMEIPLHAYHETKDKECEDPE